MKKACFFIDGFSFKRISDYYKIEDKRRSRLNIKSFEIYLRYEIERRLDIKSDCENLNIEKHFYHPNENPRNLLFDSQINRGAFRFEDNLIKSNYSVHYATEISPNNLSPNLNIFTDAVSAFQNKKFDIFILFSTQKEFANLLRYFKERRITTMLIGWDGVCKNSKGKNAYWQTDKILKSYANAYSPLEKIHPLTEIMFERNRK